jgi:2'-5' RNA ligase
LADYKVQNYARRVVYEMDREHSIELLAALVPAHVTLKQPFSFESMARLEEYFDSLAAGITPFRIEFDKVYYTEWEGYGILGLNVVETDTLRGLHNQINRELSEIFEDTSAPHDGEGYHFHMTIEMGVIEEGNPYRAYFEGLEEVKVNLGFQAKEICLAYYVEKSDSYMCYKVMPLTGDKG